MSSANKQHKLNIQSTNCYVIANYVKEEAILSQSLNFPQSMVQVEGEQNQELISSSGKDSV
jgi:hypothetical protein